jgi:altronate hydrolase
VLIVSLGCEIIILGEFVPFLGEINNNRVKFLVAQDEDDEFESGVELLKQLIEYASAFERTPINIIKLKIGLKCGGSDAFSGITANPLCGRVVDKLPIAAHPLC